MTAEFSVSVKPTQGFATSGAQNLLAIGTLLRAPVSDAAGFRTEPALSPARNADDRLPAPRTYGFFTCDLRLFHRFIARYGRCIRLIAAAKGFDGTKRNIERRTDPLLPHPGIS